MTWSAFRTTKTIVDTPCEKLYTKKIDLIKNATLWLSALIYKQNRKKVHKCVGPLLKAKTYIKAIEHAEQNLKTNELKEIIANQY